MDSATHTQAHRLPTTSSTAVSAAEHHLYSPVAAEMEQVEELLRHELQSRYAELRPILQHGALLGGKRMRPALVLLCGAAVGNLRRDHVTVGAVLEMVHTATLVHDDVLDSADHRRHLPTINARWSNSVSILLGDYLFSHSFYLAATLGSTEACRLIGEAARGVCEGELRQVLSSGNLSLREDTYLELIRGKTAELTRVSCRLGAQLADGSAETIRALADFGTSIGIAFQIADDYLDLWGTVKGAGKSLGSDLRQGKATLPLIRYLATADDRQRRDATRILQGPAERRVELLLPVLERSDARAYTLERARFYVDQAVHSLAGLPHNPARSALLRLARFSVDRQC